MFYRSDWPELGLSGPLSDEHPRVEPEAWQGAGNSKYRWVNIPDDFESQLYGLPVYNLHLEILDSGGGWLAGGLRGTRISRRLRDTLRQFLERAPWSSAYIATKIVRDEPLFQVLTDAGFEQVEHRCLYTSRVSKLQMPKDVLSGAVRYQSLAELAANRHDGIREQILEICDEAFRNGYSRHFADAFLRQRVPGSTYIQKVMRRNFERVPLHLFLLALDTKSDSVCGFTVLSERSGSGEPHYTQLLSAVRAIYRGKGIYAGLARLLTEILPDEARLLNVTHAENHAMQHSYKNTGRSHYADTLVLRLIVSSAAQSESGSSLVR